MADFDLWTQSPSFDGYPVDTYKKPRKEGDFIIKLIELYSYTGAYVDVTTMFTGLNLYQDIFDNFISGDISLQDAVDLPHLFPLIGQEIIKIRFTRPVTEGKDSEDELPPIDVKFRIYKMSGRKNRNDKIQNYTLHFTSNETLNAFKKKVSRGYKDELFSTMVENIFNDFIKAEKGIEIEKTKGGKDFVVPMLTPFQAINLIGSKSISDEGYGASFVFFEDVDTFKFISIGKLLDQDPVETYYYRVANVLKNDESETFYRPRTLDKDILGVEHYSHTKGFDILNNLTRGMYSSKMITFDTIRMIFNDTDWEFDIRESFGDFKHLADNKTFNDDLDVLGEPESIMKLVSTNKDHDVIPWLVERDPTVKPVLVEDFVQYRASQIQQIHLHAITVVVSGDPRRKVGQVIEFQLPQNLGNVRPDAPQELDNYLQGKYLIVALKHTLYQDKYYMEMQLVKDSYVNAIEFVDPVPLYKPVY